MLAAWFTLIGLLVGYEEVYRTEYLDFADT